ncbi:uncharacterized protein JCM10292_005408 [Rhodotorula paludigena]|uniref:uncharacterized protein n=1 Tax=Rhodotorula paludigena TaxID=86838 RepID=UPI00317E9507
MSNTADAHPAAPPFRQLSHSQTALLLHQHNVDAIDWEAARAARVTLINAFAWRDGLLAAALPRGRAFAQEYANRLNELTHLAIERWHLLYVPYRGDYEKQGAFVRSVQSVVFNAMERMTSLLQEGDLGLPELEDGPLMFFWLQVGRLATPLEKTFITARGRIPNEIERSFLKHFGRLPTASERHYLQQHSRLPNISELARLQEAASLGHRGRRQYRPSSRRAAERGIAVFA